jgi:hypothetical protein
MSHALRISVLNLGCKLAEYGSVGPWIKAIMSMLLYARRRGMLNIFSSLSRSIIVPCSQALGRKLARLCWWNSNSLIGAKCDKRGPEYGRPCWPNTEYGVQDKIVNSCPAIQDHSLPLVYGIWMLDHCVWSICNFCVTVSLGSGWLNHTI